MKNKKQYEAFDTYFDNARDWVTKVSDSMSIVIKDEYRKRIHALVKELDSKIYDVQSEVRFCVDKINEEEE